MRTNRWVGIGLVVLGAALALTSLLGPLVAGVIRYRLPETPLNQQIGADAFALAIVAPLSVAAGILILRRHRAGPVLALAPATYALYIFAEEILAPEYLRLPGNNELYFPLFIGVFILAGVLAVGAWSAMDAHSLPARSRRKDRLVGGWLLAFAAFMVIGRYVPGLGDAMSSHPKGAEYLAGPTLFWTIAFEDLGFVLPAAVAAGIGLLLGRRWAQRVTYTVVGWTAVVPLAVAAMSIAMRINHDPTSKGSAVVLLTVIGVACSTVAAFVYAQLFRARARRARSEEVSLGSLEVVGAGSVEERRLAASRQQDGSSK
ncbi:MAG TPA: hypothetical protein VGS09_05960 [Actinomycetota bacterium]|nr:hypothetical protein [Actinomycetota bacterium]